MIFAPGIAKGILAEILVILNDGNVHAHRHVADHRIMDGVKKVNDDYSREASDFSDALMDISYLIEKLAGGKDLGEVVRSSSSIVTKNAVLRVGAAELLDPEAAIEHITKIEDDTHQHIIERAILNQVILLLDIYETSLKDKDIAKLQTLRSNLKKELEAIRARANRGDEKAKAMVADAQTHVDNAKLPNGDKRCTYGAQAAINFLRNRVYAKILLSSSTDVEQIEATMKTKAKQPSVKPLQN